MTEPLVTVITPTRNRVALLREAVDSVTAQTLPSWEMIIVDDCSTDGTAEWLSRGLVDARIRILHQTEHRERSAARNAGLAAARGSYVLFLDDDDCLAASALEVLAGALDHHQDAVAAAGAAVDFDLDGSTWRSPHPRRTLVREIWHDVVLGWFAGPGRILWRTGILRDVGGWDETIQVSEDVELELRCGGLGAWVIVPDVVLHSRAHAGQHRATEVQAARAATQIERAVRDNAARTNGDADRLMRARGHLWRADQAFIAGRDREALRAHLAGIVAAPSALASPLVRSRLVRRLGKSAFRSILGSP